MRRLVLSLLAVWLFAAASPAWADGPAPINDADKAAIRRVIENQLAAFQKDDGVTAFAFATPTLRERFQTPEIFMEMVRHDYRPVYRPTHVNFAALENSDGSIVQHVLLVGSDGDVHEALYYMARQKDGTWLIDGCLLLKTDLKSS